MLTKKCKLNQNVILHITFIRSNAQFPLDKVEQEVEVNKETSGILSVLMCYNATKGKKQMKSASRSETEVRSPFEREKSVQELDTREVVSIVSNSDESVT